MILQKIKDGLININWALYTLFDGDTWDFFNTINSGWIEMEFIHRYGDNPTEQDYLEWMMSNSKKIYLNESDFNALMSMIESDGEYDEKTARVLNNLDPWEK